MYNKAMSGQKTLEERVKGLEKRVRDLEKRLAPSMLSQDEKGRDELYQKARNLVIKENNASASFLQRKLIIGYARAARILDELYIDKVIGPAVGAVPRKVLVKK